MKNLHALNSLAILTAVTMMITLTATTAYAQQQQQQNGNGPCPPGFSLNRGVCQAEPTVTEIPAECPVDDVLGFQVFKISEEACTSVNAPFTVEFESACYQAGGEAIRDPTLGHFNCVFTLPPPEIVTTCDVGGVLNEESGLCEIKPGKGSK